MRTLCRILFFVSCALIAGVSSHAQLIEKAPASPVTVVVPISDSVNSLIEISEIILTGFKRTKPYIIQREVPFKKGQFLQKDELEKKLNLCKQQLMNTSLFVDVDVRALRFDSSHVFIDIHVKERWYLFPIPYFKIVSRNFNTWWVEENHSLNRIEYGLKFMQNNFTGRNDNLNMWFISGYTQQFSLRYDNPNIDSKLKHGANIGFGIKRNRELSFMVDSNKQKFYKDRDNFLTNQQYVDLSYTYRPAIRTRHSVRFAYVSMGINDTVLKLNPKFFSSNVTRINYFDASYNYSYINVDYIPYPLKGFMGDASVYKRFGRYSSFWGLGGRANYSIKLFPTSFLQLQAAGGIKFPFNQPHITNTFMGGADFYMRGLEYYVVEGVAGGILRTTAKNEVLSFNLRNPVRSKTHDKIPFRLFLKAYGDLGYSYSENYNYSRLNNKLLKTWGVGLDIVTFYDVVLRFEYSFNQLGDKGLFFHNQNDW